MTRPDYSEYEQRRAENHELAWRFAATLVNIRSRHCKSRLCRRYQTCCGPMLPSDHQLPQVRAQQEIGLTGKACAALPLCMAQATVDHYADVREVSEKLTELRGTEFRNDTTWEFMRVLRRVMRRQHRQQPTGP